MYYLNMLGNMTVMIKPSLGLIIYIQTSGKDRANFHDIPYLFVRPFACTRSTHRGLDE
jgi:hypothetical protein